MIWIDKQQEPASWRAYRETPNAKYEAKPELREALLKEQGYICAYCMRGIPVKDVPYESADSKIEHVLSRKKHEDLQLEYNNMVICCPGRLMGAMHCDAKKGEEDIQCSPLSREAMQTIRYWKDGTILSTNPVYNDEINNVLNLNIDILKSNRKALWDTVLKRVRLEGKWRTSYIQHVLERYQSVDADGKRRPYCGIVIYMLQKKLRDSEFKRKK